MDLLKADIRPKGELIYSMIVRKVADAVSSSPVIVPNACGRISNGLVTEIAMTVENELYDEFKEANET